MKFLLGTKQEMTQTFDGKGNVAAGTVLRIDPTKITQVKTKEKDGYTAVQIATGVRKAANVSKALKGHFKDLGSFASVKEFRLDDTAGMEHGAAVDLSSFTVGEKVTVSAISKAKGFQGVVKRHGFHGGRRTHGQKHSEREPGSIGGGLRSHVPLGIRMAGRMGGDRVTVKNLSVLAVDPEKNEIIISGAIPGRRGTLVEIVAA